MSNLEELQKRIERNKLKEIELSPFESFIFHHNIKKGLDKVPAYMIWYLYIQYSEKNSEEYLFKQNEFFIHLKQIIDNKRSNTGIKYLIDKSSLRHLPLDFEFKAKLWKTQTKKQVNRPI